MSEESPMRILDLFCCEGGAALGYANAGFEVVGVDLNPKFSRRYPFEFHAGDALEFAKKHAHEFDAIHASPPCQAYSVTRNSHSKQHPKLIEPTRGLLTQIGLPYIIENVVGAPLIDPIMLCGRMFDLHAIDDDGERLIMDRHRLFESNVPLEQPEHLIHDRTLQVAGSYGGARKDKLEARYIRKGGYVPAKHVQENLLGIHHMTQHGLYQSLPPVYTEFLGKQLIAFIERQK
jgi:DNA (cytosine-5)-methyltransferase 1